MFDRDDLQSMWTARATGGPLSCGWCRKPTLALSILETSYHWCCMACGAKSPWFSVWRGSVTIEGRPSAKPVARAVLDDGS